MGDFIISDVIHMDAGDRTDRLLELFAKFVGGAVSYGIILVAEPGDNRCGDSIFSMAVIGHGNRAKVAMLIEKADDKIASNRLSRQTDFGAPGTLA